jgi:hypothetical protein
MTLISSGIRACVDKEARRRGVKLSVGEIGERLAIEHFCCTPSLPNLMTAPTGTKNVDALSRDGDRYSIKTIQRAKKTGTVYPDDSNAGKQLFEFMLIVSLDTHLQLKSIYQFSWVQFLLARAWDRRMNAWYVPCSQKTLAHGTNVL